MYACPISGRAFLFCEKKIKEKYKIICRTRIKYYICVTTTTNNNLKQQQNDNSD